ncbi:MAG TPA: VOC family protein [Candidatus Acidoferrum sp.]|nr:VOC family protein [Candidatus Acidoferrum sp.]
MPILSIDHVQIAIPIASENRARAFYSGILGFTEVAKPPQMAERKSIWFIAGAVNLHLGIEPDFTPAKRAHPALIVEGLDTILAACERAAISAKPDTSFNGFRRVHVFDPFGNRLELMERAKP